MTDTERLDVALVGHGLARSRGQASDLVARGLVSVGGRTATKVSQRVGVDDDITVTGDDARWVSRAAHKLVGAFADFGPHGWTVDGLRCLDLGACTGGFTQVLLDRGAAEVLALDVGHDQLAPEIAADPRVVDLSGTTVRGLTPDAIGGPVDRVVGDLSFISLRLALPAVTACLTDGGEAVLLVKPQFEVGRSRLSKHGVVTDPRARADALRGVLEDAATLGLQVLGLTRSPISGGEGNTEYLVHLARREDVGLTWQAQEQIITDLTSRKGPR
ncbi:TlyA family RNA methyltransferase [Janibacter sp. YIM B02568]|uniref:TlyA family RNA methyltransferase n=1 Tax=Janibacter endophyticus TaxID=2806261 RepID=UPI00195146A3|nr:TlyA family RNA methyltransferase [Janibacter endophyticus]MBM6546576.1 TlyA family RNA methyltransferase [Janibacter endophyticus]